MVSDSWPSDPYESGSVLGRPVCGACYSSPRTLTHTGWLAGWLCGSPGGGQDKAEDGRALPALPGEQLVGRGPSPRLRSPAWAGHTRPYPSCHLVGLAQGTRPGGQWLSRSSGFPTWAPAPRHQRGLDQRRPDVSPPAPHSLSATHAVPLTPPPAPMLASAVALR